MHVKRAIGGIVSAPSRQRLAWLDELDAAPSGIHAGLLSEEWQIAPWMTDDAFILSLAQQHNTDECTSVGLCQRTCGASSLL